MSGRKSTEVVNLLSTGDQIRREVLSNEYKRIDMAEKENEKILKEIGNIKKELMKESNKIDEKVREKFKEEVELIENELRKIIKGCKEIKELDFSMINTQRNELEKIFENIEKEGDRLRQSVRNRYDYCNSEYYSAQQLVNQNQETKKRVIQLSQECLNTLNKNKDNLKKYESDFINKNQLEKRADDLKIRSNAQDYKETLEREFKEINREDAVKFVSYQYAELEKGISSFITLSANEINEGALSYFNNISKLKQELSNAKEIFELKKEKVNREFQDLQNYTSGQSFKDIEALLDSEEVLISLFDFQEKYSKNNIRENYYDMLRQIDQMIKNENFDEATKIIKNTDTLVKVEVDNAGKTYERMLQESEMCRKIIKATVAMGYDVDAGYIGGDIRNGYTVEAKLGDEIIDFDRILIDNDGNPVIDLDHEEGTSGTCGNTMKKLQNSLLDEGIFITDITKNGTSVIYKDKSTVKEKINNNKVSTN